MPIAEIPVKGVPVTGGVTSGLQFGRRDDPRAWSIPHEPRLPGPACSRKTVVRRLNEP